VPAPEEAFVGGAILAPSFIPPCRPRMHGVSRTSDTDGNGHNTKRPYSTEEGAQAEPSAARRRLDADFSEAPPRGAKEGDSWTM
jgi:hypothetical protein